VSPRAERRVGAYVLTSEPFNGQASVAPNFRQWLEQVNTALESTVREEGRREDDRPLRHSAEVMELVYRCRSLSAQLLMWLREPRLEGEQVAAAMDVAVRLGDELQSLQVNANLFPRLAKALRMSEEARARTTERHAEERPARELRNKEWASIARKLNQAGWTRREILDRLSEETRVKRATLEKIPCIRAELPRTRRNSDP
jgi:hypothetical protein